MEAPMFYIFTFAVALVAAFIAGTFEGARVEDWLKTWSAARALKAAQAVVDAEVARVTALENARAAIVAHKATGPSGPTGA